MAYTEIDDPTAYFQSALYTGNAGTNNITFDGNSDMQPNLIWIKERGGTGSHIWVDTVRGISSSSTPFIKSNSTGAEVTNNVNAFVTSSNSDGFSLGADSYFTDVNKNNSTYAAWNWKAGGSASSNSNGSITSSVSANQDAGFSIVSYSGNSTAGATIGHGLGAIPKMMIVRKRNSAENWLVYHASTGNTGATLLNGTNAFFEDNMWNSTSPTSSVFTVHGDDGANGSGGNYIAYCFAEKKGYSKFSSYVGNGNADGTFVYTGFKPAFVMLKRSSSTSDWYMFDSKREGYNVDNDEIYANLNYAEDTADRLDILSNGFKMRTTGGNLNGSGETFIYMAFAENPFVTSTGVPATAR